MLRDTVSENEKRRVAVKWRGEEVSGGRAYENGLLLSFLQPLARRKRVVKLRKSAGLEGRKHGL